MISHVYSTDLSDQEWAVLAPLLPPAKPGGRPRSSDLRAILDAIFYVLRSGCQWRLLPRDFPPWSTVYDYFRKWQSAESLGAAPHGLAGAGTAAGGTTAHPQCSHH